MASLTVTGVLHVGTGSGMVLFFEQMKIALCLACGTPKSDAVNTPYST